MKKIGNAVCLLLVITLALTCAPTARASDTRGPSIAAAGAYVMDFETGAGLYSHDGDTPRVPASMTKVMSLYIMLEALSNGEISFDDEVPISDRVYALSRDYGYFNTVPLYYNQVYTVDELIDLIVVYSASASVVAMAELISGSEEDFIARMNAKAAEMGLDAYYVCSAGLGANYISPRSMATLARNLIMDYPEILERSAKKSVSFHGRTYANTNLLLGSMYYEGADGLKTGTTSAAGYCFCGTASRGGVRLITVVMASSSTSQRYIDTQRLLDYGFSVRDGIVSGEQPDPSPEPEPEPEPEIPGQFIDVPAGSWFYDGVMLMWENGIMRGSSGKTFEPYAPMTRAMAACVLYRAAREPETPYAPVFPDVETGLWYSEAAVWAWGAQIARGDEDGMFRPDELVTREEFALMLYRFAGLLGYDLSARAELDAYSDADDISDPAKEAMSFALATGLITGTSPSTLSPGAHLDRAQCAVILTRAALGTPA